MTQKLPISEPQTHRVVVIVRTDCPACLDTVEHVTAGMASVTESPRVINLDLEDISGSLYDTVITPAIYIDETLWAYGSVDPRILNDKLATLAGKTFRKKNQKQTIFKKEK